MAFITLFKRSSNQRGSSSSSASIRRHISFANTVNILNLPPMKPIASFGLAILSARNITFMRPMSQFSTSISFSSNSMRFSPFNRSRSSSSGGRFY